MIKVELDEKEIKKAITYFVARKFSICADDIRQVDINYDHVAIVTLEQEDDDE